MSTTPATQYDDEKLSADGHPAPLDGHPAIGGGSEPDKDAYRSAGVLRVEAIARAGDTRSGRHSLYLTAALIWMYVVLSITSTARECARPSHYR
jgi:hypothetical protein